MQQTQLRLPGEAHTCSCLQPRSTHGPSSHALRRHGLTPRRAGPAAHRPSLQEEPWPQPQHCLHTLGAGSSAPPSAKACEPRAGPAPGSLRAPPPAGQLPLATGSPAPRGDMEGPCPQAPAFPHSLEQWGPPALSTYRRRRAGGQPRQSSRGFLAFRTGLPVLPAAPMHQHHAHLCHSCHGNSLRASAREG